MNLRSTSDVARAAGSSAPFLRRETSLLARLATLAHVVGRIAALLTVAFAIRGASAQGTGGAFPDPISVGELNRYAERIGLDAAQRIELDAMHEAYRDALRELRDGPIEEYLKAQPSTGFLGQRATRDEIEASIRERRRLLSRIERIESEFFDRVAGILRPEQMPTLEAVRDAARRDRSRGTLGPFVGKSVGFELATAVAELELPEDRRAALTSRVVDHERRVTKLLAELSELSIRQSLDVADALAALGASGLRPPPRDGATDEAAIEARRVAMEAYVRETMQARRDATAPQREKRWEIARLNRAAVSAIVAELPEEAGWRLHDRFVSQAYPEIGGDRRIDELFDAAVRLAEEEKAPPETIEGLRAAHRATRAELRRLVDEAMNQADAAGDEGGVVVLLNETDAFERREARLEELREKREDAMQRARAQLDSTLGPERAERLASRQAKAPEVSERRVVSFVAVAEAGDGGDDVLVGGGEPIVFEATEFMPMDGPEGIRGMASVGPLPQSIDVHGLRELGERLGLEDSESSIIEVLHRDYVETYGLARDEERAQLRELGVGTASELGIGQGGAPIPSATQVERGPAVMRGARERLGQIDTTFFDEIDVVVGSPEREPILRAARAMRERALLRAEANAPGALVPTFSFEASREADVDVASVVESMKLDAEARALIADLLRGYDDQALGALRRRADVKLEAQREIDRFHADAISFDAEGRVQMSVDSAAPGFEAMDKAQQRIAAAKRDAAEVNRSVADAIAAALPEEARERFRRAYNRAAWPRIFADPHDGSRKLEAALALEELEPALRTEITTLMTEHVAAYEALCDRMIAEERSGSASGGMIRGGGGDEIRALQTRQNAMRRLRFERAELNATTLRKLSTLLDPAQRERIGGVEIPEPKERPTFQFGG